jgi:phosphate transport system substrate-binding protein
MKNTRFVLALVLSACGQGDQRAKITIKGSDTMVILGQRWAESYMQQNAGVTVQVTGGGSGTGIAALIDGATDICQASRPMKDKERDSAKQKRGKDVVEIPVALDAVAIYLNESNPLAELTLDQIKSVYTGKIKTWDELGWTGGGPIVTYGRENNSGTYVYFKEHVLGNADFNERVQTLPGTSSVANAVSKDKRAIGYGGIAYLKGIKAIKAKKDAASPGVEPAIVAVVSGDYPISRKLFFYTSGAPEGATKAFIDWVLSPDGQKVVDQVGFYPLPGK